MQTYMKNQTVLHTRFIKKNKFNNTNLCNYQNPFVKQETRSKITKKNIINKMGAVYLVFVSSRLLWCKPKPIIKPFTQRFYYFTPSRPNMKEIRTPNIQVVFDQDKNYHGIKSI